MNAATPFYPKNMDGYGSKCRQMNNLRRPFYSNQVSIFFQEIWIELGLLDTMIRACGRWVVGVLTGIHIPEKNMDASCNATGLLIVKQVWILIHIHPYFSCWGGKRHFVARISSRCQQSNCEQGR